MTYIALHVEKWLYGSTKMEMEHDEIACLTYILARAAVTGADPPGQIYYFSEQHLANQLQVPLELLKRTLEKCIKFKKIKIKTLKRENKFVLSIVNWEKYQHVYLHQKAYRQRQKAKREAQKKQISEGTKKHNRNITDYNGLVDRIGEDNIKEEIILEERKEDKKEDKKSEESLTPNKNSDNSPFLSNSNSFKEGGITIKEQFLSLLKGYKGYPFDEFRDSLLFDVSIQDYQKIDIIKQTKKKIAWWREHPDALKANPRKKLQDWFKEEFKFQKSGGPQQIGEIMEGIDDHDQRNWVKQIAGLAESKEKERKRSDY